MTIALRKQYYILANIYILRKLHLFMSFHQFFIGAFRYLIDSSNVNNVSYDKEIPIKKFSIHYYCIG